jgi:hypothetical protein
MSEEHVLTSLVPAKTQLSNELKQLFEAHYDLVHPTVLTSNVVPLTLNRRIR